MGGLLEKWLENEFLRAKDFVEDTTVMLYYTTWTWHISNSTSKVSAEHREAYDSNTMASW